jgi:hypothetical protein
MEENWLLSERAKNHEHVAAAPEEPAAPVGRSFFLALAGLFALLGGAAVSLTSRPAGEHHADVTTEFALKAGYKSGMMLGEKSSPTARTFVK